MAGLPASRIAANRAWRNDRKPTPRPVEKVQDVEQMSVVDAMKGGLKITVAVTPPTSSSIASRLAGG
jgi:hypothetical protein